MVFSTHTKRGEYPHKEFTVNGISFLAPVFCEFTRGKTQRPMTHNDELVYAMPAGGRITESGEVIKWPE